MGAYNHTEESDGPIISTSSTLTGASLLRAPSSTVDDEDDESLLQSAAAVLPGQCQHAHRSSAGSIDLGSEYVPVTPAKSGRSGSRLGPDVAGGVPAARQQATTPMSRSASSISALADSLAPAASQSPSQSEPNSPALLKSRSRRRSSRHHHMAGAPDFLGSALNSVASAASAAASAAAACSVSGRLQRVLQRSVRRYAGSGGGGGSGLASSGGSSGPQPHTQQQHVSFDLAPTRTGSVLQLPRLAPPPGPRQQYHSAVLLPHAHSFHAGSSAFAGGAGAGGFGAASFNGGSGVLYSHGASGLLAAPSLDTGVMMSAGEDRLSGETARSLRFARMGAPSGAALMPTPATTDLLLPAVWPATPEKGSSHHSTVGRPEPTSMSSGQVSQSQGGLWPSSLVRRSCQEELSGGAVRRSSSVVVVSPTHSGGGHIPGSLHHPGAHLLASSPFASSARLNSACSLSRGDLLPAVDTPSPAPPPMAQSTTPEPQEGSSLPPRIPPPGGRLRRLLARMAAM